MGTSWQPSSGDGLLLCVQLSPAGSIAASRSGWKPAAEPAEVATYSYSAHILVSSISFAGVSLFGGL